MLEANCKADCVPMCVQSCDVSDAQSCGPGRDALTSAKLEVLHAVMVLERICEAVLRLDKLANEIAGLTLSFLA